MKNLHPPPLIGAFGGFGTTTTTATGTGTTFSFGPSGSATGQAVSFNSFTFSYVCKLEKLNIHFIKRQPILLYPDPCTRLTPSATL